MGQGGLIKPLHGLRGLAALSVVLHHLAPMKFSGAIGVTLFFVLSGYLMGRIYLDKPFGPREVWRYGTARFARIYPLFAVVLVAAFMLNAFFGFTIFQLESWQLDRHLVLLGGNFTVWTIAVECYFYALFLGFWYFAAKDRLGTAALLVLFVALAVVAYFVDGRINILRYLHIFVGGMVVARLSARYPEFLTRHSAYALPVLAAAFVLLASQSVDVYGNPLVVLVTGGLVCAAVNAPASWFGRALSTAPLLWLGEISYGVYLLHRFAQQFVARLLGTADKTWLSFGLGLALTLAMAFVVYRLFEDPMRRMLRGVSQAIETRFDPGARPA